MVSILLGELGAKVSGTVSVPYDPSMLETEDDLALARAIHDDTQKRIREWFDEEFVRSLYA